MNPTTAIVLKKSVHQRFDHPVTLSAIELIEQQTNKQRIVFNHKVKIINGKPRFDPKQFYTLQEIKDMMENGCHVVCGDVINIRR